MANAMLRTELVQLTMLQWLMQVSSLLNKETSSLQNIASLPA